MISIGQLSRRSGVKVPTIRYYETIGLLCNAGRTAGNQRRYDLTAQDRLAFIRHARDLGFSLDDIRALIALHERPDHPCAEATAIAQAQLTSVRDRIARLAKLEQELARIASACDGTSADRCHVLHALATHEQCQSDHDRDP